MANTIKCESLKVEKIEKSLKNFENFFTKDKNNLVQITTKETGSFEEMSKQEEYPFLDHDRIFANKYKKKSKLIEQVIEIEQEEKKEKKKIKMGKN